MKKKVLIIFGTRPEAIKLVPIIKLLNKKKKITTRVCITGQHLEMLNQVLKVFNIKANYNLRIMEKNQSLNSIGSKILEKLDIVLKKYNPNLIVVHGDTTTTFISSLAAFHNKISIAHVEAGLRTHNLNSPFPEELNRKFTDIISNYHFAPTIISKNNLIKENLNKKYIYVTGNTVVDSVKLVLKIINQNNNLKKKYLKNFNFLDFSKKIILVTGHRRESFGKGFQNICKAIIKIAEKFPTIQIVYPVHLNPNVRGIVQKLLKRRKNIFLLKPLDYFSFTYLMQKSHLILTDSGGIQEEAPSLGKPVLVMRNVTERPEAVKVGAAKLVGNDVEKIFNETSKLINNFKYYKKISKIKNPYGDGKSSQRIVNFILKLI